MNTNIDQLKNLVTSKRFRHLLSIGKYSSWFNPDLHNLYNIIKIGQKFYDTREFAYKLYLAIKHEKERHTRPHSESSEKPTEIIPRMNYQCVFGIIWQLDNFYIRYVPKPYGAMYTNPRGGEALEELRSFFRNGSFSYQLVGELINILDGVGTANLYSRIEYLRDEYLR